MKRLEIPVDNVLFEAVRDQAFKSKRTVAGQVRFILCAATGIPYKVARRGRAPSPWLVVKTVRYGRGVVSRHRSEEAAKRALLPNTEVIPIDQYEAEGGAQLRVHA